MNSISQVYEILSRWRKKFQNLRCISVLVFEDEMRIRIDWYGEQNPSYTERFSQANLEDAVYFDDLENFLLDKIESAYIQWEVGEK